MNIVKAKRLPILILVPISCIVLSLLLVYANNYIKLFVLTLPISIFCIYYILKSWNSSYIISIFLIGSINFFGLFGAMSIPHISLPGLGTVHFRDILFFILLFVSIHYKNKYHIKIRSNLNSLLMVLFFLTILITFYSISLKTDPHMILRGLRKVVYIYAYFGILWILIAKDRLSELIKAIYIIAIISAIVSLLQCFFGISTTASKVSILYGSEYYRVYQSAVTFLVFSTLLYFTNNFFKNKNTLNNYYLYISFFCVLFFGTIAVFYRSVIINLILSLFLITLIKLRTKIGRKFIVYMSSLVLLFGVLFTVTNYDYTNISFMKAIQYRMHSAINDMQNFSGTLRFRYEFMLNKFEYVYNKNKLIGIGFTHMGKNYDRLSSEVIQMIPYTLTADNTFSNIFILYGLIGISLFIFIYAYFFISGFKFYFFIEKLQIANVVLAILIFNLYVITQAFFTSLFTMPANVSTIACSWAMLVYLKTKYKHYNLKERRT